MMDGWMGQLITANGMGYLATLKDLSLALV